jgi:uncharacterized membrane protein
VSANSEGIHRGGAVPALPVRRVPLDAPWDWLAKGWRDLSAAPLISLTYGAVFALAAWGMTFGLALAGLQSLMLMLAGGFMLIGPLLAVGLYEMSRRLEKGETVTLGHALNAGRAAKGQLGFFAVILMLAFLAWVQIAFLLLMLFLGEASVPDASAFVTTLFFTGSGRGLLVAGTLVGAAIAAIVFSISAVAVPLLLDRDVPALTAMATSVGAVSTNVGPMLLWAALIAGIMILGLATVFAGLAVTFPLVGHATWHAYRALVEPAATL